MIRLLCLLMPITLGSKFISGPTSCLFKRKGHYFCGTQNDISAKPASWPFRTLGYCCTDDEKRRRDRDCRPEGDWCTPESHRRNDTDPAKMALYMSYVVGMTFNPEREKICGTPSINLIA